MKNLISIFAFALRLVFPFILTPGMWSFVGLVAAQDMDLPVLPTVLLGAMIGLCMGTFVFMPKEPRISRAP